ncbi:hypothetical protein GQR58_003329 [Nymphon striatum]|nr:hypothetical protein GQR58_003329 [Nymphon striatum]
METIGFNKRERNTMNLIPQIKQNSLALISLFVAFSALSYNTWRNEASEENRNIRTAGFEVLLHIGNLQRIAYLAHFDKDEYRGNPRLGWTEVLLIKDLCQLLPDSTQKKSETLVSVWGKNWKTLSESDEAAVANIDIALNTLRKDVLQVVRQLD